MSRGIRRREFVTGVPAAFLVAAGCSSPAGSTAAPAARPRPAGVPVGPYGASSTAEEVTSGLDLSGKLALVTGATSGLGRETLRVLSLRGADVIATGRTRDRAAEACAAVAARRSTPLGLDLERWDSVVAAAAEVRALGRPLDVLICNAGIMAPPELRLVHGVEQQFAVNHLGHFILCQQLMPSLRESAAARVVVVSSALLVEAPSRGIEFDNLDGAKGYDARRMYGQSKLANALFAFELARRTAGTNVTANTLHPGVANTNLDRESPAWRRLGARLAAWNRPWVKSVEAAAATQVYVATAPALATVTGHFFEDCNPVIPSGPHLQNRELATALWATSEELTRGYLS